MRVRLWHSQGVTVADGSSFSVEDALWRDLLEWIAASGTVLRSDDSRTIYRSRGSRQEVVLGFGPAEWAQFVLRGDWLVGEGPAGYDASISGAALDLLWETVGSQGSPIIVRDGRVVRE